MLIRHTACRLNTADRLGVPCRILVDCTCAPGVYRTDTEVGCDCYFFFQAEDGIRDIGVTGVQTCALPILEVRGPGSVPVGGKPTFELVVTNVSSVPCVRVLDEGLQEIVMSDAAGNRVWGSNDCFPGNSSDTRTLAPGESVAFPLVWGGLTSEPSCTAARTAPAPGQYALRGRLGTKVSADASLTLG